MNSIFCIWLGETIALARNCFRIIGAHATHVKYRERQHRKKVLRMHSLKKLLQQTAKNLPFGQCVSEKYFAANHFHSMAAHSHVNDFVTAALRAQKNSAAPLDFHALFSQNLLP